MDGTQIAMARAALGWTAQELADKSGVSRSTIMRAEAGAGSNSASIAKLEATFEAAGLVILGNGHVSLDGGPGVRFKKRR